MPILFAIIAMLGLQGSLIIYCLKKQNMKAVREDLRLAKFQL